MYRPVPAQVDLPAMEHEVLRMWDDERGVRGVRRPERGPTDLGLLRGPADRERHARHAPRRGPRLQGRLPPVPHDEGVLRAAAGGLGLPRPARRAGRREGARLLRQGRHRGVRRGRVQRTMPRVRAAARRRVLRDDPAHGLLGRHGPRLLDHGQRLRPERVVVAQADLRQGPARAGPPRRPLLPALRHRPVRPRAGAGLRERRRPVGLRAVPRDCREPTWPRSSPASPCSCGPRPRGPSSPTPPSPSSPRPPTPSCAPPTTSSSWSPRSWSRALFGDEAVVLRTMPRHRPRAHRLPAALRLRRDPRRALRDPRRLRHHRRRHRPGAPGARLRRRRPGHLPGLRPAGRQPGAVRRALRGVGARRRRAVLQEGRRDPRRRPRAARADVPARAVRALLPALLALPHAVDLLRAAVLVHPHHGDQGRAARRRTRRPTGSRRPSSGVATATG